MHMCKWIYLKYKTAWATCSIHKTRVNKVEKENNEINYGN